VIGLLDDDPAKQGLRLSGVPLLGRVADLALDHVMVGATHVIVAMPGVAPERRNEVIALAKATGLEVLTLPSQSELQGEGAPASAA